METGSIIRVKDCFGRILERRLVKVSSKLVYVSNQEEYDLAAKQGREPQSIGFRKSDVEPTLDSRPATPCTD